MSVLQFRIDSLKPEQLLIKVKNISGAPLEKTLSIELSPPAQLLDKRVIDAARAAAVSEDPPGVASLADFVSGPAGWSIWAMGDMSNATVVIMLRNDRDQQGDRISPPNKVDAGAEFTIGIPLNPTAQHASVTFSYIYQHGTAADDKPDSGMLEWKSDTIDWNPEVSLTSNQASPSMIKPGTDVKISWKVKDGVSAILRGPLPGGNSEWTLSDKTSSDYKMSEGSFELRAVGTMTYILQAEVARAGKPNVQVVRTLSLDVYTREKYGYISARPHRVLPYGLVEFDWAAWGVKEVIIDAGATRRIPLTEMTLSGYPEGVGIMRISAPRADRETPVSVNLNIEVDRKPRTESTANYKIVPWRKMQKSTFTGKPVGLAIAAPRIALLTTDGLWTAKVGDHDFSDNISYDSVEKVEFQLAKTDKPKAWLAIAALGDRFVVLRKTNQDDLQVALYTSTGTLDPDILPIDLPADLRPYMGSGSFFDLAVYKDRAYLVVEAVLKTGTGRRAFSVNFDRRNKKAEYRAEPLLEPLQGYRLLAFDHVLYGLNRDSGQMLRFVLVNGKLDAEFAASAVDQSTGPRPPSMVRQGLLVPVGRVLAVLSPSSVPSLKSLDTFGLKNVLPYNSLTPPKTGAIPQDLVYSPQNNRWSRCGHGIDVTEGVVAFRGGDSQRLWLIDNNGDTYTLAVSSEHLFAHDYVTDLPSKQLVPVLNKTRTFKIVNNTNMQYVEMNDTCRKAGVMALSSTGPIEMTPPVLVNLRPGTPETIQLRFNELDPPTVTLRFLLQRPAGITNEYFLEYTLSGPNLSIATTVFKRIAVDANGAVTSVVEVPETRRERSSDGEFEPITAPFVNGIAVRPRNLTPYQLWLRSPHAKNEADREKPFTREGILIKYDTTPFSIYAHGAGELFFDVDFGMPHGIEENSGNVAQTTRLRVNTSKSQGLRIESPSVTRPNSYSDDYDFALRYKLEQPLPGVYMGDGVPSKDGSSFYLPLASPPAGKTAEVLRIDANNLSIKARDSREASGLFVTPNSVTVVHGNVLAILKNNHVYVYDENLIFSRTTRVEWQETITALKGSPNDHRFYTLGLQIRGVGVKYSYSFAARSVMQILNEPDVNLDAQKGFRSSRAVTDAPAWVTSHVAAPMDVSPGNRPAICVEGGLFLIDLSKRTVTEVAIDGTGRPEAVLVDPVEPAVYCAHAKTYPDELRITRINMMNLSDRRSITLPSPIAYMVTDTKSDLRSPIWYNRARAVSLALADNSLFVSHGTKIHVLSKSTMAERGQIPVDLPCRLIQVRRGTVPGSDPRYGSPQDCYLVWAIGSSYTGDGQNLEKFKTSLYKFAFV
ncbi:MAG TPA: hypothetical protein VFM63_07515 [Pyrinomonadaceae bacterium]|nr:hypothetical protein [Pyrinomonadaceae bacterium]